MTTTTTTTNATAYTPAADGFFFLLGEMGARFAGLGRPTRDEVRAVLRKRVLDWRDFGVLLSPEGGGELEAMAERANGETLRHFGYARQLFAPLYLANYCTNRCVYCGFHAGTGIERKALTEDEIEREAEALAATGLRRVLVLTGDAPARTGAGYIARAVGIMSRYFPSVGIEVQALKQEEYAQVAKAGADSMTMFQETYDPVLYERLHPAGPKRDFGFRLDAPQRAATAGMRGITLGALLGLGDWRFDIFMAAMHGQWLQRRFPEMELSFSLPRIRPRSAGERREDVGRLKGQSVFDPLPVSDREFVQALTALRCFLPHVGITLSTRESAFMRDRLLGLGVTRLSAGVCTAVGGYATDETRGQEKARDEVRSAVQAEGQAGALAGAEGETCGVGREGGSGGAVQFVIDDERSVADMAGDLQKLGYQPVFADWLLPGAGEMPLAGGLHRALGTHEGADNV